MKTPALGSSCFSDSDEALPAAGDDGVMVELPVNAGPGRGAGELRTRAEPGLPAAAPLFQR